MQNVLANIYRSRHTAMKSLEKAIALYFDEYPAYLDFSHSNPSLAADLDALESGNYSLWCSDPDSLSLLSNRILSPSNLHIIIFNGLNDALSVLLRYSGLSVQPLPRLTLYTFDPIPLPLRQAFPSHIYKVVSYPFCNCSFSINVNSSSISYAAEFNKAFSNSIGSVVRQFPNSVLPSETLRDYLCQQRYASCNFLNARDKLYSQLASDNWFHFVPIEQSLATTLTDIYRLRVAHRLAGLLNDYSVYLLGDHFSEIGLKSFPTNRLDPSLLQGTISIDPGSHTLANHAYFRPCDLLEKGALPVPIGYTYDHIHSQPCLPFLPDASSSSFTQLASELHASNDKLFAIEVYGSFPFRQ
jgi:hypothetical protein